MAKESEDKRSESVLEEEESISRRDFLVGLKKWSKVVVGSVLAGTVLTSAPDEASAGSWINRRGGWINRPGGWYNGGWANRGGSWLNGSGGGWGNRGGGGWINRSGGGWINRRGGLGWINRR